LTIKAWVYFWALYSVPLICVSVFVPEPYCFDYRFVVYLEVYDYGTSALFFFFKIALAVWSSLVPYKF